MASSESSVYKECCQGSLNTTHVFLVRKCLKHYLKYRGNRLLVGLIIPDCVMGAVPDRNKVGPEGSI